MPLLLIVFLIADIVSVAYPFIAYYLWKEWDKYNDTAYDDYAERCLYGAIAIAVVIVLGRFLIKFLLGKRRRGEERPAVFHSSKRDTIKRPDGTHINVEYFGKENGQPIIFVHGWNANSNNWYYQRKFFEKDHRLIMMDLPGLGKSTRPHNKDFSLEKMAADLQAVIEHTQARNAILWGHSMGGMTILTLLAKHNNRATMPLKGIILEHTTYTNPVRTMICSKLMTALEKPVLRPICWLMITLSPLLWISRWMSYLNGNSHIMTRLLTFAGTQTPGQLDFSTLLSTMAPPAVMARGVLAMFKYDVTQQLPQLSLPALIIAADKDRLTKPVASEYMHSKLPNASLVTVSPGNHQSLLERHREVNEAAKDFIRKVSIT